MNDNEKVAALAAAVDGMRAKREWYRSAWLEATAQRDDLQARNAILEDIKASQNRYIGQYQKVLKERQSQLDLAEAALQECSVDEMNWNRERDRLEGDLEHAQNTVARLVEERDAAQAELRKHYGQRGPTCVKWLAEGGMREVLDILSQPHPVNVSEAAAEHLERGLGTNMIWARQVVAQINAWWQDAREAE